MSWGAAKSYIQDGIKPWSSSGQHWLAGKQPGREGPAAPVGSELHSLTGLSFWPRRAVQEGSQQLKRSGGSFPFCGTCGTNSGVGCPVLGSPVQERHWHSGVIQWRLMIRELLWFLGFILQIEIMWKQEQFELFTSPL